MRMVHQRSLLRTDCQAPDFSLWPRAAEEALTLCPCPQLLIRRPCLMLKQSFSSLENPQKPSGAVCKGVKFNGTEIAQRSGVLAVRGKGRCDLPLFGSSLFLRGDSFLAPHFPFLLFFDFLSFMLLLTIGLALGSIFISFANLLLAVFLFLLAV